MENNIENLLKNDWVHISSQTETSFLEIANLLGKIIQETNVIVKPESKALVTSERGLSWHTDHHKANFVAWFCKKQTDKGGETFILDAKKAYSLLEKEQQDILKNVYLFEHKVFEDDKESYPLVNTENNEIKFYFSFWLMKKELSDIQRNAVNTFYQAIENTEKITIKLQENDILIINNHHFLHGRNAIEGSKDRFLKRLWITKK